MIEAQQRDMGASTDFLKHNPIILKADAAGVLARRIMAQKIRAEAGPARGAGSGRIGSADMARYMLFALNGPTEGEGDEAVYNDWYHAVHMPDLLALDGVIAARRFKAVSQQPHRLALCRHLRDRDRRHQRGAGRHAGPRSAHSRPPSTGPNPAWCWRWRLPTNDRFTRRKSRHRHRRRARDWPRLCRSTGGAGRCGADRRHAGG